MSESGMAESQIVNNRPMALKEIAERIAKLGIARASNKANRRFLLSHLRAGNLVAYGLVKLPLCSQIEIPQSLWQRHSNVSFRKLTDFSIRFDSLVAEMPEAQVTKHKDEIKNSFKSKKLEDVEETENINKIKLEVCVYYNGWLKFLQLPEVQEEIENNKANKVINNESNNSLNPQNLVEHGDELDADEESHKPKREYTYQLLIKAIFEYSEVETKKGYAQSHIIDKYFELKDSILSKNDKIRNSFMSKSSLEKYLLAICEAKLDDFSKGEIVKYNPKVRKKNL